VAGRERSVVRSHLTFLLALLLALFVFTPGSAYADERSTTFAFIVTSNRTSRAPIMLISK